MFIIINIVRTIFQISTVMALHSFYICVFADHSIKVLLLMTSQLANYSISLFGKNKGPSEVEGMFHFCG